MALPRPLHQISCESTPTDYRARQKPTTWGKLTRPLSVNIPWAIPMQEGMFLPLGGQLPGGTGQAVLRGLLPLDFAICNECITAESLLRPLIVSTARAQSNEVNMMMRILMSSLAFCGSLRLGCLTKRPAHLRWRNNVGCLTESLALASRNGLSQSLKSLHKPLDMPCAQTFCSTAEVRESHLLWRQHAIHSKKKALVCSSYSEPGT